MDFPKGSEWRRWDLHLHTPLSEDYLNSAVTDEDLVSQWEKQNIACVAVTDHHVIGVERIRNLQALADGRTTVFPVSNCERMSSGKSTFI
ncbi:MAG: hypothetical protein GWP08_19500 [Nitrospiraceae bacterium]|nr:hypothetical protein [Nitrospiraceae bacterium]